jgi:hypothetical protein
MKKESDVAPEFIKLHTMQYKKGVINLLSVRPLPASCPQTHTCVRQGTPQHGRPSGWIKKNRGIAGIH